MGHPSEVPDVTDWLHYWWKWRKTRPHPSEYETYAEWLSAFSVWKTQRPKVW